MSLDMNSSDAWRHYKKQLQQAEYLQEDLTKQDPLYHLRKKRPHFVFSTAIMFLLEDLLSDRFTKLMTAQDISALLLTLHSIFIDFQKTLSKLCPEDLSMQMPYLQELSTDWKNLETIIKQILKFKKTQDERIAEVVFRSETFMLELNQFRANEQFPLAYYLEKQAGQEWIPFPFMRIVQHLHDEFRTIGVHSTLQKWLYEIDALIAKTQTN
jgi:hypothetical protein